MAYFKIEEPNKPIKWIKKINGVDGTLEFTDKVDDAHYEDDGFFADSERGFLEFHFMDSYPELQYMTLDSKYYSHGGGLQGMAFVNADAVPQEPGEEWAVGEGVAEGPVPVVEGPIEVEAEAAGW